MLHSLSPTRGWRIYIYIYIYIYICIITIIVKLNWRTRHDPVTLHHPKSVPQGILMLRIYGGKVVSSVGGVFKLEKGRAVREFEKRRVCARVFMQQQRALLLSLSLSLSFDDDDDAKKGKCN